MEPGVPGAAVLGPGEGRAHRLTVRAETWKVQLNARLLSLSNATGLVCARCCLWKHCLFIICADSQGIGATLEGCVASFLLASAGVMLSICDKRPAHC